MIANLFDKSGVENTLQRLEKLTPDTTPEWGKMSAPQMLAHLNVAYEMSYEEPPHKKPGAIARFLLKTVVKNSVVSERPYKKNSKTAPAFVIQDDRDFAKEKERLISYLKKTQQLGAQHFDGKESMSFGSLTKTEWNNMFSKHIDHHFRQFGV